MKAPVAPPALSHWRQNEMAVYLSVPMAVKTPFPSELPIVSLPPSFPHPHPDGPEGMNHSLDTTYSHPEGVACYNEWKGAPGSLIKAGAFQWPQPPTALWEQRAGAVAAHLSLFGSRLITHQKDLWKEPFSIWPRCVRFLSLPKVIKIFFILLSLASISLPHHQLIETSEEHAARHWHRDPSAP